MNPMNTVFSVTHIYKINLRSVFCLQGILDCWDQQIAMPSSHFQKHVHTDCEKHHHRNPSTHDREQCSIATEHNA